MKNPPCMIAEGRVAELLGVNRSVLQEFRRKSLREKDWYMVGNVVLLTEKGIREILSGMGLVATRTDAVTSPSDLEDLILSTAGRGKEERPVEKKAESALLVFVKGTRNGKIGLGYVERDVRWKTAADHRDGFDPKPGAVAQRIQVRDTVNLRAGMEMTCTRLQADLWEFTGRLPRYPGRW